MHNKLQIPNLHIIMYLSGKKEQMLAKVISQLLDTPVPSPGLFFILLPANGKVRLASKLLLFPTLLHCFTVQCSLFCSVFFFVSSSSVPQTPVCWPAALHFPAAFYPVLLLIIAQITYRDTFFFEEEQKKILPFGCLNRCVWIQLAIRIGG